MGDWTGGLRVIDISNPSEPTHIASLGLGANAYGVDVVNGVAYLANYQSGLRVVDVTNPSNPSLITSLDTPSYAQDVEVRDGIAYVSDSFSGLRFVDVSAPASPSEFAVVNTPDSAVKVELVGNFAYVADAMSALRIIDLGLASGGVCGDGGLDAGEECDDGNLANGDCCSAGCQFESTSTICRSANGVCDVAEACTGSGAECPVEGFAPDGSVCSDDDPATFSGQCNVGTCVGYDSVPAGSVPLQVVLLALLIGTGAMLLQNRSTR